MTFAAQTEIVATTQPDHTHSTQSTSTSTSASQITFSSLQQNASPSVRHLAQLASNFFTQFLSADFQQQIRQQLQQQLPHIDSTLMARTLEDNFAVLRSNSLDEFALMCCQKDVVSRLKALDVAVNRYPVYSDGSRVNEAFVDSDSRQQHDYKELEEIAVQLEQQNEALRNQVEQLLAQNALNEENMVHLSHLSDEIKQVVEKAETEA